jgi:hypothetical protein
MTTRRLALAAVAGPPLFAAIVVLLTAIKWDFLHELGWSAGLFESSDTPWPSSLALGDYGILQVLNFLLLGLSVLALAVVLFRLVDVRPKIGPGLVAVLAIGFGGTAFRTDYKSGRGGGPDTWNGVVHAAGFTVVVFVAILSMFVLAVQLQRDERWHSMSMRTLVAAIVALAALIATLAGAGNLFFYVFLGVLLAWLSFVSAHALSLTRSSA